MTKRWKHRPSGSTWGDWGDDDELGRINLLTPEKVLQGVREVEAGISFCLSLPLDYPGGTSLNQRRYPPVLSPTEDMDGNPGTFYNVPMSTMEKFGDPKYVDVWADDVVTLSLQYSTQWDSLAHVGAEFDADGDGIEEPVYYNGYRAGDDLVGPKPDARGDGGAHRCFAHHLGLENMAATGVQGRGVLVDLAHHLGHDWRGVDRTTLEEIMVADKVVVEPGDMLLLHTGFATEVLRWNREPDPVKIHTMCTYLDARDESLLEWISDSKISALVADDYRGGGDGWQGSRREPALVPPDSPSLSVPVGRTPRRDVVSARARIVAARAQPEPVSAHCAAPASARCGRLTVDARCDCLTWSDVARPQSAVLDDSDARDILNAL